MFTNKELPSNFPRPRFDDAWCPPSSRTRGGPATCHCWPRLFQWRVNLFWAIVHPLFCPLFYPLFCHRRRHSFYLARTTLDKAQTSVPPTTITNNHHQQPPTTSQPPAPATTNTTTTFTHLRLRSIPPSHFWHGCRGWGWESLGRTLPTARL